MRLRKWFEKLIFVPWLIIKTNTQHKRKLKIYGKITYKDIEEFYHKLDRLYVHNYCSSQQYIICFIFLCKRWSMV